MKREIKFRAWDNTYKMFRYFTNHPQQIDIGSMIYRNTITDIDSNIVGYRYPDLSDWEQFTGLQDIKGVDIYDGDIVKWNNFYEGDYIEPSGLGWIEWDEEQYYVAKLYDNGEHGYVCSTWDLSKNYRGEVIGNIHQNPELL